MAVLVADCAWSGKGLRFCVSDQIRVATAAHRPLPPGPPTHKSVHQQSRGPPGFTRAVSPALTSQSLSAPAWHTAPPQSFLLALQAFWPSLPPAPRLRAPPSQPLLPTCLGGQGSWGSQSFIRVPHPWCPALSATQPCSELPHSTSENVRRGCLAAASPLPAGADPLGGRRAPEQHPEQLLE